MQPGSRDSMNLIKRVENFMHTLHALYYMYVPPQCKSHLCQVEKKRSLVALIGKLTPFRHEHVITNNVGPYCLLHVLWPVLFSAWYVGCWTP